jgi:hypothetical protein
VIERDAWVSETGTFEHADRVRLCPLSEEDRQALLAIALNLGAEVSLDPTSGSASWTSASIFVTSCFDSCGSCNGTTSIPAPVARPYVYAKTPDISPRSR